MSSYHLGERQKKIKYRKHTDRPVRRPWAIFSGAAVIFKALIVAIPIALILESIGIVDLTRVHAYTNPYTDPYISPLKTRWAKFWNTGDTQELAVVEEPAVIPEMLAEEVSEETPERMKTPVVEIVSAQQEDIVLASEPAEPGIEPEARQVETIVVDTPSETADDSAIVTTYRATFFSDPSSVSAAERPIARGTRVRILQRQDDWVKVEAMDSQEIGFIHESHLQ